MSPSEDDFRIGAGFPSVSLSVEATRSELSEKLKNFSAHQQALALDFLASQNAGIEIDISWERATVEGKKSVEALVSMASTEFDEFAAMKLAAIPTETKSQTPAATAQAAVSADAPPGPIATSDNLEVTATEELAKPDALAPVPVSAAAVLRGCVFQYVRARPPPS